VADGDYYASYDDIRHVFMDAGLGTVSDTFYDDKAVEVALETSFYVIQLYLDPTGSTTSKLTNPVHAGVLKGIQCDLVMMRALQAQWMQKDTIANAAGVVSFFRMMPALTREHKELLEKIKYANRDVTVRVYDTRYGNRVY